MKIGIVTITHGQNYGNRLQNYAVQRILEKQGAEVETIRHRDYIFEKSFKVRQLIKQFSVVGYTKRARRIDTFTKFNKKNIRFSKFFIENKQYRNINEYYDAFVCGSDQIWNPDFFYSEEERDSYFLSFVDRKPKVALSASFGVGFIPEKEKERIAKRLNELTAISIREESGKKIIKELTGLDSKFVIDPTLSLKREDWVKIEEKPKLKGLDNFIFIYLLGQYGKEKLVAMKHKFENEGKTVVFLENEYNYYDMASDKEFAINPAEFIWLIHHCNTVITDSFHAIIFSLLFRKEFSIVERDFSEGDLSSRIKQLIDMFNLDVEYFDLENNIMKTVEYDYNLFIETVEQLRVEYIDFINDNIIGDRNN